MNNTVKDLLFYGKVKKNFYKNNKNLLNQINYKSVKLAYLFATCFFALLAIIALMYPVVAYTLSVYVVLTIICAGITVLVFLWLPRHLKWERVFYFVFEALAFAAGIVAGTIFSPRDLAVQFFVLLIVLPLLYIEKPISSICVSLLASAVFMLFSYWVKGQTTNFEIDVLNCICCLIIGIVFIYYVRNMHLKNIQATLIIQRQSETDGLTGILNKTAMEDFSSTYLKNYGKKNNTALYIMDIDEFKKVNDHYGHKMGDELLRGMGKVLMEEFTDTDYIGRVGGDEFMVLQKNYSDRKALEASAQHIIERISGMMIRGTKVSIGCSIGIVTNETKKTMEFQEMYRKADEALYHAKNSGKGRYDFYIEQ